MNLTDADTRQMIANKVRPMLQHVAVLAVSLLLAGGCAQDTERTANGEDSGSAGAAAAPDATAATPGEEDAEDAGPTDCGATAEAEFPDVVAVQLDAVQLDEASARTVRVSATLCSAYDTPERYADAWRVMTPDGEAVGVRELLHDHAGEQPFTRSLSEPIEVPDGVQTLVIEGRDLVNGWGGATIEVSVPLE